MNFERTNTEEKLKRTLFMKKWEYETHWIGANDLKDDLNKFGQEGWELVNIYKHSNHMLWFLTFKRPL